jgi:hypothetical protein
MAQVLRKKPPARHIEFHAVLEALPLSGCPACRLGDRAARRWLRSLFHESINDGPTRDLLRQSHGFCARHACLACRIGDALGWSILAADVTAAVLRDPLAQPTAPCPACAAERSATDRAIETLLAHIEEDDFASAYARSEGLCLPHLRQALRGGPTGARQRLERIEREKLTMLLAQLNAFVEHADYRHTAEAYGSERNAWLRAARKLSGTHFAGDGGDAP